MKNNEKQLATQFEIKLCNTKHEKKKKDDPENTPSERRKIETHTHTHP